MNHELHLIAAKIAQAASPEDVFGPIPDTVLDPEEYLKKVFRQLAQVTHPDHYQQSEDQQLAQRAFQQLSAWYRAAQVKIRNEYDGHENTNLVLETKKRAYHLSGAYKERGFFNEYPAHYKEDGLIYPVIIKLVRDSAMNDLAQNENRALQSLVHGKEAIKFWPYLPRLLDSFVWKVGGDERYGNVFEQVDDWFSLEDVRVVYSLGIDARDAAWMWRRLLVALGFAHHNGWVHGAVLPCNVWLQPNQHGVMLVEWTCAVLVKAYRYEVVPAIHSEYADWYPMEVLAREPPLPATDIAMAARCMIYLMGGDPVLGRFPPNVPAFIRAFFKGCLLPGKRSRPQDAWQLLQEFDELIERYWGERKFRPFVIHQKV